ncbi:MAG TPA: hypothetical protein VIN69_11185 [Candidatus Limnocylindria bacterium]
MTELIIGAVALALFVLLGIGLGALGLRLNRRGIRRGTYPLRNLPWYLGGVPDVKAGEPVEGARSRRRRRR